MRLDPHVVAWCCDRYNHDSNDSARPWLDVNRVMANRKTYSTFCQSPENMLHIVQELRRSAEVFRRTFQKRMVICYVKEFNLVVVCVLLIGFYTLSFHLTALGRCGTALLLLLLCAHATHIHYVGRDASNCAQLYQQFVQEADLVLGEKPVLDRCTCSVVHEHVLSKVAYLQVLYDALEEYVDTQSVAQAPC